ncbi:MAG: hypothetical protein ACI8V2_000928 [Candidatus Latescibacterota bacterium]|jgi:hypothetical protein
MQHYLRMGLTVCLLFGCLGLTSSAQATAITGSKMPAFKLQALDEKFYGTEGVEGKISLLYFLGHNCAPCVGFGPFVETDIWQKVRNKPGIQMMGLDIWNGSITQLNLYKSITKTTYPLLRQAGRGADYAGISVSELVVVDQEGYIRLTVNGEGLEDYPKVFEMIESLERNTPIIQLASRSLYYGQSMNVGQVKTTDVTVNNTGAGPLEITGMETSIPNLTMDPPAFTVPAYGTQTATVTFAPSEAGTYTGSMMLAHTNGSVQKLELPLLSIAVEGQIFASIALAQTRLDFGQTDLDKSVEKTVTITNAGPGILNVSDIQSDVEGLVFSDKQFSIAANESKDITVTFHPPSEGSFLGVIQVMSDDPDDAILTVSLSGTGIFIPADPRTDFDGSGRVEFSDFVAFAQNFGSTNTAFDFDGSGRVDFADFLTFASSFGKSVTK